MDFYEDLTTELENYFQMQGFNFDIKKRYSYEISKDELKQYVQREQINFPLTQIDSMSSEDVIKKIQEIEETFKVEDAYDWNKKRRHVLVRLLERYVNLQRKRLHPLCKREVHISKELYVRINNKEFPERICKAINCIKHDLQNGIDVSPRLSKGSRKIGEKYDDTLLSEFSIYHFHLSNIKEANGKSYERTNELLFVYIPIFDNKDAYFLNVVDSHADNKVFADIGLLQLIKNNWPSLLNRYTFQDIKDSRTMPISTNEQYQNLRKMRVNSLITLEDKTEVMKPGFGIMSNGKSLYINCYVRYVMRQLEMIESQCKKAIQENPNIDFKLKLGDSTCEIYRLPDNALITRIPILT